MGLSLFLLTLMVGHGLAQYDSRSMPLTLDLTILGGKQALNAE